MIECRTLCERAAEVDGLNVKEEWLPSFFFEDGVESAKIAGPDPDEELGGISEVRCSTIYFRSGHVMIVDIPFSKLKQQLWPLKMQQ